MKKHSRILSMFFLIIIANEFNLATAGHVQAEESRLPKYAVHYITKGDNLHLLAAYYLNSPRKWKIIFNGNREVIKNPNQLVVGKKLLIPVSKSWIRTEPYEKFKARLAAPLGEG